MQLCKALFQIKEIRVNQTKFCFYGRSNSHKREIGLLFFVVEAENLNGTHNACYSNVKNASGEQKVMNRNIGHSCSGMTLVETAVAMAIFALCIGGMCALIVTSKQLSDRARWHYTAVNLAKSRLERARALPFGSLDMLQESKVRVDRSGFTDNDGDYRRTTYVNEVKTGLLKEIVVIVEILNRKTLDFDGSSEHIRSYFANYFEPED